MKTMLAIFLILFLTPTSAFAILGTQEGGPSTAPSQTPTLEGCFGFPDPGMRSGCLMEAAVNEKDVTLCDLIEIPGMVHDCIDGVAAVTKIDPDKCKIMNEKFRDHCLHALA